MASATYIIYRVGFTNVSSGTNVLSIMNGSGSGKTVKVTRVWRLNSQITSTVTGALASMELWRMTGITGETSVTTIVSYDSSNAALPAQITAGFAGTVTLDAAQTEPFCAAMHTGEEITASLGVMASMDGMFALNRIWDAGFQDTDESPIVLPEGYGLTLRSGVRGASTVGSADAFIEFVVE